MADYYNTARAHVRALKTMQEDNKRKAERRAEAATIQAGSTCAFAKSVAQQSLRWAPMTSVGQAGLMKRLICLHRQSSLKIFCGWMVVQAASSATRSNTQPLRASKA